MAYRKKSGYTIFLRKLEIKEIAQLSVQGISYAIESEMADPSSPLMYANNIPFSLHTRLIFTSYRRMFCGEYLRFYAFHV